jgi:hypothetical protein
MGQFERTLIIVDEDAYVHYVEGCTAPIYSSDSLHSAVVEIVVKKDGRCRRSRGAQRFTWKSVTPGRIRYGVCSVPVSQLPHERRRLLFRGVTRGSEIVNKCLRRVLERLPAPTNGRVGG